MRLIAILSLCSLIFVACNHDSHERESGASPDPGKAIAVWPATVNTEGGSYSVTVNPAGGEIVQNEHFSLELTITSTTNDPSDGALQVKVDADMPAHQHGMNTQPELTPMGDARYRVDGMLFHMAGEWVIMVDVTADTKTERATFAVQVE